MGGMSSRTSRAAFEVYSLPRTRAIERRDVRGVFRCAPPHGAAAWRATRAADRLKSGAFWALLWRKVNSGLSARRNRNGRLSLNR